MNYLPWILIILAAINAAVGNLLISKSQKNTNLAINLFSLEFVLGCFLFALNLALFAYALKFIEVSKAYPVLSGISFITLAIFSTLFLKDQISLVNFTGLVIIILGIYLILK